MKIKLPSHLTDTALVAEVLRLAGGEREGTARLVAHLAEFDRRRLYLGASCSSLYAYCRSVLRLSEPEAYIRMKAARAVRRFPLILEMLLDGSLNLTTLRLLIPHLKSFNHESLLGAAAGKSKREVMELLARLFPQPDVRSSVRKLPAARPAVEIVVPLAVARFNLPAAGALPAFLPTAASLLAPGQPGDASLPVAPAVTERPLSAPPPVSSAHHRPLVTPLALDRYQITFTATTETRDKLEFARDLLRHAVPNGDPAAIIDRALTALLEDLARKKFAAASKPRPSRGTAKDSRHIPAEVKRAVWIRDLGRCAFVAVNGRRCNERGFVEFHHVRPFAAGGPATVANISLRCKSHNQHEADLYYGLREGEDVVRERAAPCGLSAPNSTGSGPSCVPDTQLVWTAWQDTSSGFVDQRPHAGSRRRTELS